MEGDIYAVDMDKGFLASRLSCSLSDLRDDVVDEGRLGAPARDISQPVFNEFEEVDRRFFARESAYRRETTIVRSADDASFLAPKNWIPGSAA